MESINSALKLFVKKFWLKYVSIFLNFWLIILHFLSILLVLVINLIKFIKLDFKCTFNFLLINISISESFLQIRASLWVRIAAICLNSIQSIMWLLISWNHEALLMSCFRCSFSPRRHFWIPTISKIIKTSFSIIRWRIMNMPSFISSNLLNIWLMFLIPILVLTDRVPTVNDLVATIVNYFRISSLSVSMDTLSSMCSLLHKMSWWFLSCLNVVEEFFFEVFLNVVIMMFVPMASTSKSLLMLFVSIFSKGNFV